MIAGLLSLELLLTSLLSDAYGMLIASNVE
jgi:hypothetical protein